MSWSISEVARMTGLTSRALRHYDAIGLLRPAWTADGGRRHYEDGELLRLQEILLLRDLGLRLNTIEAALATRDEGERVDVLRRHRRQLEAERDRYERLLATVDRTIASLEEGTKLAPEEIFDGLIENPYEEEAREKWGNEAVDASYARLRKLSKEDRELLTSGRGWQEIHAAVAALAEQGVVGDDPRLHELVERHYRLVSLAWTPNREAYIGLGEMYLSDPRFAKNIGNEATVNLLADAMRVYAEANLSA
ncbi:MAG TPA: TipAS antibiotic-recognition domain-containing protein [Trueperaceae bacterium]|nr:TipAS antibiotic-recognition domain-containing protein [Trueperaceae bacterium]